MSSFMVRGVLLGFLVGVATLMFSHSSSAAALYTPEVEIGHFSTDGTFEVRGHGILVKFGGDCLIVTLAHVAQKNSEDTQFDEVTARSIRGSVAMPEYVDYSLRNDLYVGKILADSEMLGECDAVASVQELYDLYRERLDVMLSDDFVSFSLHMTPDAIKVSADGPRALTDAIRGEPIRYTASACNAGDCLLPTKKLSGSILSLRNGSGDRFLLGLHQGLCDLYCSSQKMVWQAVSMVTIYEFFYSDRFPLKPTAEISDLPIVQKETRIETPSLQQYEAPQIDVDSSPFKVDGRATDVEGLLIGNNREEVDDALEAQGYDVKTAFLLTGAVDDNYATEITAEKKSSGSVSVISVRLDNKGVFYVRCSVEYNPPIALQSVVDQVAQKYGRESWSDNGPGIGQGIYDFDDKGNYITGKSGDVSKSLRVTVRYGGFDVSSVQTELHDHRVTVQ